MANKHPLKAEKRLRTGSAKLNELRREGWAPAVVYGKDFENVNIKINTKDFATLLGSSASEHILVELNIESQTTLALIQDIQHNALTGQVIHADFLAVDENKTIHAEIPLQIVGEPAGVKQGGILDQSIHELVVVCQAKDLPEIIEVDVSALEVGDLLHISDLKLPANVKSTYGPEVVVATVLEAAAATSEAAAAPAAPAATEQKA